MTAQHKLRLASSELGNLLGCGDEFLRHITSRVQSTIVVRGNEVFIDGPSREVTSLKQVFKDLEALASRGAVDMESLETTLSLAGLVSQNNHTQQESRSGIPVFERKGLQVLTRSANQTDYVRAMNSADLVFAVGPAGTGKTYLAVAQAVRQFLSEEVERIILVRPVVEAGENLGFLPGDLKEKVEPYFRPIYDALMEMIPPESLSRYLDQNLIEVAPLAYMRGRTLSRSMVILDEAQNTTGDQLKMFLTRLGNGTKAVVTGDLTQIDLAEKSKSGLQEALDLLQGIKGIQFVQLTDHDVVRHPLVRKIIQAYERERTERKR